MMTNPRTLAATMQDTVSYKLRTDMGAGGVPTYGALQTASAKVWDRQNVQRDARGEEVITRNVVHSFTEIPRGSLLWLPGEDTTDDSKAHVVDYTYKHTSCGVRGNTWTMYEIRVESG